MAAPDQDQEYWTDERSARLALAHVVEPGDPGTAELVATYGVLDVWHRLRARGSRSRWAGRAAAFDLRAAIERTRACGARFVVPGDEEWPGQLDVLAGCEAVQDRTGPPMGLWARGARDLGAVTARGVAMVGSRASTSYGEHVALQLGHDLVESGIPVVSGAAYGIDAAAHRGALSAGPGDDGPVTVAVLACGVDQVYPAAHADLLAQVAARGSVVSELPPGEHPTRLRFLARNRLIAALSRATLIVEAAYRSGARNTVTWAQACGRPVMAVPGPVTSALSVTPNRLLRDHEAELVSSVEDVRALLSPTGQDTLVGHQEPPAPIDLLGETEKVVLEALPGRGSVGLDELSVRAALPLARCAADLEALSARGLVTETLMGEWQLTHRHLVRRA
ncbi:DNA processing protein [Raineyella antarctica]|uniref:DNA processing protein n=1 Tax=Raineyella antarctica TaxID=1577474 RepID=A0A1G6HBE9_9ACTN|nr:DNA-processing protein DprA [Raineyella antarctica]SDB91612.1 DNA processing protein [Raineyella antarctica]